MKQTAASRGQTRRQFFETAAAAGLAGMSVLSGRSLLAAEDSAWRSAVLAYLDRLSREGGGYGWDDQQRPHLTPTFAVIACYRLLDAEPPRRRELADYVLANYPSQLKKLEQEHRSFDYQQVQSLIWLGADASPLKATVLSWKTPRVYLKQYERHGYPVFQQEIAAILCRALLGVPVDALPHEYIRFLDSRRRANGSYNNTPAEDGTDGNVLNTWWGLQALNVLGRTDENQANTVEWLSECQLSSGGFTHQPRAKSAAIDDVAYTWAAVKSLALLNAKPRDLAGCKAYLRSLWNADSGFGDRPGWASNPLATYYALDALKSLDAFDREPTPTRRQTVPSKVLPPGLKVYSIQLEAHGQGSPAEAVDLAAALKIHLWGAKNARPAWLSRAQEIADHRGVPLKFFVSNEEYGTWVDFAGQGTYSHTSDVIAPSGAEFGGSLADAGVVSWEAYRERRLAPLLKGHGRLIWQFGENEPLVRIVLDDSLLRGGFAAISTFHFGNPDFTNSEPFLKRYRMQLPFVALQDAHGSEPWWFADMTTGFRTLFLATEPTWEGWLTAVDQNWVVAVRHDAVSGGKTWMHGGPENVLDFVREHSDQWQWWDNPGIERPLVSIVPLKPSDELEVGRPSEGVAIRVRCAWQNTPQGLAKTPIVQLDRLVIDGEVTTPRLMERRRPNGLVEDHYHLLTLRNLSPGRHSATAHVRELASGRAFERTVQFVV